MHGELQSICAKEFDKSTFYIVNSVMNRILNLIETKCVYFRRVEDLKPIQRRIIKK